MLLRPSEHILVFHFSLLFCSFVNSATSISNNQAQMYENWFHSRPWYETFKAEQQNKLPVKRLPIPVTSSSVLKLEKAHALQMSSPITQLLANELPNLIHYRAIQGFD